jgi:hypothetical protein
MTPQAVGAYGERIVEAELLRRGWLPGNLNHSITNSARFDIVAVKANDERIVPIRVKTCSPKYNAFQFSLKRPESDNPLQVRAEGDFFVLVAMGESRPADRIYIVPTDDVQTAILAWRKHYIMTPKKDGGSHKETSQWTLHLGGDETRLNSGFGKKWSAYLDEWSSLEQT